MSKTEPVRLPKEVLRDARIVSAANGESLPEYVSRITREAVERDLPKAAKILSSRVEAMKGRKPPPSD